MATKSVLKSVDIKTRKSAQALVSALENAERKASQPVENARVFTEANRDEIRKMFGVQR